MHRRRAMRSSASRRAGASAEAFAQFVREETNGGKLLLAATRDRARARLGQRLARLLQRRLDADASPSPPGCGCT